MITVVNLLSSVRGFYVVKISNDYSCMKIIPHEHSFFCTILVRNCCALKINNNNNNFYCVQGSTCLYQKSVVQKLAHKLSPLPPFWLQVSLSVQGGSITVPISMISGNQQGILVSTASNLQNSQVGWHLSLPLMEFQLWVNECHSYFS